MMFWRVFMRLSYRCPAHLKFSLTVERWTDLVKWSRESIEWLDQHDRVFDSWMFVSYAASGCAFIQVCEAIHVRRKTLMVRIVPHLG